MFLSNGQPFPAQAETLAESTPLYVGGNYYSESPLALNERYQLYTELYRRQLWVYTIVTKLARSTSRLNMQIWEPAGPGRVEQPDSPYAQLLANPNPRMSSVFMWLWVSSIYEIFGEAILLKLRDASGRVRELHPMHPMNTTVRRHDDDSITYWFTSGVRDHRTVLPEVPEADVVHFKAFNPDNIMRGMSQLEPLRRTLANEDSIRTATDSFWKRGAQPSVILSHPGKLSEAAAKRVRASWESAHAGAERMGGTAILEENMTPTLVQLTNEQMQYVDSRRLNREEVCAAMDVPPPVVHILDNATYSNITEQMRSMYRDTMAPRLGLFESELDSQLAPDFGGGLLARFNLDDVLRGDFESRATAVTGLVTSGVYKPDEARPLFNLPTLGGAADKLYANQAMQPLGTPVAAAAPPAEPAAGRAPLALPAGPIDEPPTVRSLLGRLAGTKGKPDAMRERLVSMHEQQLGALFGQMRQAAQVAAGVSMALPGLKAVTAPDMDAAAAQAGFDPRSYNQPLAQHLAALSAATGQAYGTQTAAQLGGSYDPQADAEWTQADSQQAAGAINGATLAQVAAGLAAGKTIADAVSSVFDSLTGPRLAQIAGTRVTQVGQHAGESAARQNGRTHKTWHTGSNPRPEHEAVDGESVPLGERFSNGLAWPGDMAEGPDEAANCNCTMTYERSAS